LKFAVISFTSLSTHQELIPEEKEEFKLAGTKITSLSTHKELIPEEKEALKFANIIYNPFINSLRANT